MNGWILLGCAIIGLGLIALWYRWGMAFMGCYIPLRQKYGWSWRFELARLGYNLRQLTTGIAMLTYWWWLAAMFYQWVKPLSAVC